MSRSFWWCFALLYWRHYCFALIFCKYAHVEYERAKNKAGVDSAGMKAKVLQKMKEAIQYYNDNISEMYVIFSDVIELTNEKGEKTKKKA